MQHISKKSTLSKHSNNIIKSLCSELALEYRPFACKVWVHALALNPGGFGQKGNSAVKYVPSVNDILDSPLSTTEKLDQTLLYMRMHTSSCTHSNK